MFKIPTKKM